MPLFSNHLSLGNPFATRKLLLSGHAVDRFVDAIDRHFSSSPLFNRDCVSLLEVRCARGEVLSPKNMVPSLEGNFDLSNMHSESFADVVGVLGILPTWRNVLGRLGVY
jgi:hypothetical protein